MEVSDSTKRQIADQVDELFAKNRRRYGDLCFNPVTQGAYVQGRDRIKPQKEAAYRALLNREWFALNGPADAQPLPVSMDECELARLRGDLLHYILGLYGRSLEGKDPRVHPPFADYVSGVLWEADRVDGIIGGLPNFPDAAKLKKRFPPRELVGMGPGFCWLPRKQYEKVMARHRESLRRERARSLALAPRQKNVETPSIAESVPLPESLLRAVARVNALYPNSFSIKASPEN